MTFFKLVVRGFFALWIIAISFFVCDIVRADASQFARLGTGEDVACGAASAASSAAPANTTHARVACKGGTGCRMNINGTATATMDFIPPNTVEIWRVATGVAVTCIQDSAAATLNVQFLQANAKSDTTGNYQPGLNP